MSWLYVVALAALPDLLLCDSRTDEDTSDASLPLRGGLSCSACLWSAKALRAVLVEKMPRRMKAKERQHIAEEVFSSESTPCAESRFPQQLVRLDEGLGQLGQLGQLKVGYYDFDDIRGHKSSSLTSEHFQLLGTSDAARDEVHRTCRTLTRAFRATMIDKVAAHKTRIYGAITDYWLCVRQAQLCKAEDVPPGGDDDEEEEL